LRSFFNKVRISKRSKLSIIWSTNNEEKPSLLALLGTMSFGDLLDAGAILGLARLDNNHKFRDRMNDKSN